jgi:hypothetical protein
METSAIRLVDRSELPSTKEDMIWALFAAFNLFILIIMLEVSDFVKQHNQFAKLSRSPVDGHK